MTATDDIYIDGRWILGSQKTMDLREYLYVKRLTINDFAKLCDYSPKHLSGFMSGRLKASRKLLRKIAELTENQVTLEELEKMNPKISRKYIKRDLQEGSL